MEDQPTTMHKFSTTLAFLLVPILSFAHGSHGSGFMAGFTHPILGIDHNLAIVGTGIIGYVLNKKQWYFYPAAFMVMMIIGGLLGIGNEATSLIENIIVGSVIVIGVVLGLSLKPSTIVAVSVLGIFGFVHGYAHGAEMPETTTAFKYISGYIGGAALLSLLGLVIGKLIGRKIAAVQYQILIGGILIGSALMMFIG